MPLRITRRADRDGLWITGTVTAAGAQTGVRVRIRAGTDDAKLAREEAAAIEARMLRDAHHGERRGARGWGEAVASYLTHQARAAGTQALLIRLTRHFGDTPLREIGQEAVDRARAIVLRPEARPGTVLRNLVVPVRAILGHAHKRGWCDLPLIEAPAQPAGRTRALLPDEYLQLHAAAAPHLRPILTWLVGTGCRMGETLALNWGQVDLGAARATLEADTTKAGRRRGVALPPAVVAALAGLDYAAREPTTGRRIRVAHRTGAVFRTDEGVAYTPRDEGGTGLKKAMEGAASRAKLPGVTTHTLRHTFASWHYALHRDLLALRDAGGWSAVSLVERYAHVMPSGHEAAINAIWGWHRADTGKARPAGKARNRLRLA